MPQVCSSTLWDTAGVSCGDLAQIYFAQHIQYSTASSLTRFIQNQ